MSSTRDRILAAIQAIEMEHTPHPGELTSKLHADIDPLEMFETVLQAMGGAPIRVASRADVAVSLAEQFDLTLPTLSMVPEIPLSNLTISTDAHDLEYLNLLVVEGQLGVAENAAVWVIEESMGLRALPFLSQHLVLVLRQNSLVRTMHEAYEQIHQRPQIGFGSFIAGPSKTADIEQSLVIGAHGPRSLMVYLVEE